MVMDTDPHVLVLWAESCSPPPYGEVGAAEDRAADGLAGIL